MAFFKKTPSFLMTVSSFNGTDCTKRVTNSISSAEYMRNFRITENGKLQKRYGYKKLADIRGEDVYLSDGVIFYRNGKTLNAYNIDKQAVIASYELDVNDKTVYFTFGGAVYCACGDETAVYSNGNFEKGKPYIPTVAVTCAPDGGGTVHESLNLLCNMATLSYSPDGTAVSYKLPSGSVDVVRVIENGEEMALDKYSFDLSSHTVRFTSAPSGGVADSLQITYKMADAEIDTTLLSRCSFCIYGGDFDSRVFAYGKGNVIFYSDITSRGADPLYFPAENYITVGDGTYDVTALVRHYSNLAVFTSGDAWYISPSSVNYDGYAKPTFPIYPLNGNIGTVKNGAALVDNSPLTVNEDGVYLWRATNVRDERNAKCISDRIEPLLHSDFLENAKVFDHQAKKELWIYNFGIVMIYNYALDMWYAFDGIYADVMYEHGGQVLFANSTGVYLFDPDIYTDNGKAYRAIWQSGFANFGRIDKKRLYMLYASLVPEPCSNIKITLVPNKGERISIGNKGEFSNKTLDFSALDFSDFTFECEGRPSLSRHRIRLRRFDSVRLIIENSDPDGRATVERVVIN